VLREPDILLPLGALPDPAHPSVLAYSTALGTFVGGAIARARRDCPDSIARATASGAWLGSGIGLTVYLLVNAGGSI
jgi:hypothetical protein